jgi:hypothetical protein
LKQPLKYLPKKSTSGKLIHSYNISSNKFTNESINTKKNIVNSGTIYKISGSNLFLIDGSV